LMGVNSYPQAHFVDLSELNRCHFPHCGRMPISGGFMFQP
jgi:hypothetical protein